jgi:uncharacterized protein
MLADIENQMKDAMKSGAKARLQALRYMKAMLLENRTSKSPIEELDVLIKHCKKLSDSLELYPVGNEQRTQIEGEIKVVQEFLPQPLTEAEVKAMISEIKTKLTGANMGAVMKELSPLIKGKFDGKKASMLVQEALK